jgi:hypothetical protein
VLVILLNGGAIGVFGRSYYFSTITGNDGNTGNSPSSPWRTISRMQSTINQFQAGDVIYLERGSVWYEVELDIINKSGTTANPIQFMAYGSGANPVLSGGRDISGTFTASGNIWTSNSASFVPHNYTITPGGILIDNKFHGIALHPNTSYYTTETNGSDNYLTDYSQSWSANELVGGQVVARCVTWAWSKGTITSNTSNTINFEPFPDYSLGSDGQVTHYFLQNIEQGMDIPGEWCFNSDNIKVFSTTNLNTHNVEFSVVDTLIRVFNCNHIRFDGIEFRMANSILMEIRNGSYIQVYNNVFRVAGFTAIDVDNTPNFDVVHNSFEYAHGNGITADNLNVSHITDNHFYMSPGVRGHWNFSTADNRIGSSITTYYHSGPVYINNNEFDSVMIAMQSHWSNAPFYFERNVVRDYGMMCGDIAAVYMGGDWRMEIPKYIRKNIFINAHENTASSEGNHPAKFVHGIYWDYDVHGAICDSNTFINTNVVVYSNKAYGNRFNGNVISNGAMDLRDIWVTNIYLDANWGGEAGPKLDTFKYNTIVLGDNSTERAFLWHSIDEGGFDVNHNAYVNPFNNNLKLHREVEYYAETGNYTAPEYCARKGFDCSSAVNPVAWNFNSAAGLGITKDEFVNVVYNASNSPAYKKLDAVYIDLEGNLHSDSILIAPYYSKVLLYYNKLDEVNDPPVLDDKLVVIHEEDFFGTAVIDLNAIDPDPGQILTYSIINGNSQGLFQINSSTGLISFVSPDVDFTDNPTYALTVRVTDNGSPALHDDAVITIQLIEEPQVVENHPPVIEPQAFTTSYDAILPALIGTVQAYDEDMGQQLSYRLISGDADNLFTIEESTGVLTMIDFPDNKVPVTYTLIVRVEDDAENSLFADGNVSVFIAASDKIFYINPENRDDNQFDGSYEHPYWSWEQVAWEEGASYLQKRGTTADEEKILITARSVTLADYGVGEKPIINSITSEYAVKAIDKDNVLIKNFRIIAESAIGCIYFIGSSCENNSIENCELEGSDYGLRIIDGNSYTVKYNVFHNEVDGIYSIADDAEIYYNIFIGNHTAINLSSYSSIAKIFNNVFYDNRQGVSTSYAEVTLFNNIFYLTGGGDQAINHKLDKLVSNNNIFFPEQDGFIEMEEVRYNSLSEYQSVYGLDMNSFASDPLFVDVYNNNFTVTDESHAIDAGRIVGLTQDFYGQRVPFGGGPDIGMAESNVIATSLRDPENKDEKYFFVFPNPSDGRFQITFENLWIGRAEVVINSITGTTVYQQYFDQKGMFVNEIDLSDAPKGPYYITLRAEDKVLTQKIIIE